MYCGDETGAFIGDVGSNTSRFGYGGEDNPKHVVSSYIATKDSSRYIPSSCYRYHENLTPIHRTPNEGNGPIIDPDKFLQQADLIENWDAMEEIWQNSFDTLRVREKLKHTNGGGAYERRKKHKTSSSSSTIRSSVGGERCMHPLLAVRSGCTHVMNTEFDKAVRRKELEKYTELLLETLQADTCFVAPTPMLAAFSHGRQTCLVVDVGAGGCRVTPIVDGLVLEQAQRRNGRGSDWLGNITWKAMRKDGVSIVPRFQLREKNIESISPIFLHWAIRDLMFEFRTSDAVSLQTVRMGQHDAPFIQKTEEKTDEEMPENPQSYVLPDGTRVNLETRIGKDLKRVPELLFTDDIPFTADIAANEKSLVEQHATVTNLPLHKLVHASLTAIGDADLRKELCSNIVLVGGSSLLSNMEQRLSSEISNIVSGGQKCKVIGSKFSVERSYAAWIGASILTSLGSFQQLW
eukprot:CAMPEP_0194219930 /NCGR_PEP_ID=MMETSP0156-20130528/27197_1 /TAXON_ID=33649 /ORGANISM="Thalassionema nitzschioides, Strain L26-B" /LENGTH=462 /DNA_ID=CAMNT_0038949781 /DNA_START=27 /DNA_END=1412 /DNA_ORIENTATION=-